MTAKIGLEDVRIHAPHGFFEEEHLMGNEFSIDVEVEAGITGAAHDDDLGGTVNYATIYYLIQAEMKKPTQLLEALAYRMANRIMNQFDSVTSVKLRLRKLNPPLGGKVGAAVVEVNLGGGGGAPAPRRQDTFEDPEVDYEDDDEDDFDGGGFAGGGFAGGGSFFPPTQPSPAPVFDESAFDGLDDEEEEWAEEDFDDDDGLGEEGDFEIPEDDGEDYDEEDFDEEDPDFDMGDFDFDAEGFDPDDFDPDDFEGMDFDDFDFDDK